jgi:hypothetical protein
MQNTIHAVMAQLHEPPVQRHEPPDSADDFPTPPWATRALVEHVLGRDSVRGMSCLEPACGRGHMARALREYFGDVVASAPTSMASVRSRLPGEPLSRLVV